MATGFDITNMIRTSIHQGLAVLLGDVDQS